jgi:uncharacterized protein
LSVIEPVGDQFLARVAGFGRVLRAAGLEIGPSRIQDAVLALDAVDMSSRREVYWALRCTLVSRAADIEAFDAAFARVHEVTRSDLTDDSIRTLEPPELPADPPVAAERERRQIAPDVASEPKGEEDRQAQVGMGWSAVERLRELDFARYTDAELRRSARLVERIAAAVPRRRSRRLRSAGEGHTFDKRRTLRSAMRTDGYPVMRYWRERRLVPRKLVFVVDVSGSMEPYARAMVMFLQAAVRAGRTVEAFTFGTRLTRVTPELSGRDPERAIAAATRVVPDWAGGTRIGPNLKALNDTFGRRGLTRGSVVVIVSDGWERGDISALRQEMQRLRRSAHTIVWVNPLAGEPGYEPLAKGMAAAIPYIDRFLPGHNLRSLETLAEVLESLPTHRPRPSRR